ncbi:MAG TPA: ERF family protein [Acidobacteriaceae bacterium]|jgi:hypothetical protein|nr:ERF family protein [Acidobacteriaceae bacterium]
MATTLATTQPINLLSLALENNAAIDVIERLAVLQEKTLFREAKVSFSDALSRIQAEIKRIAPDLVNPQTSSKYASYAAIDRVIRPIYTREGMSLSFSHADCPKPEHVRVLCFASLGAYTRTYQMDMPCDGKGARGGDVMSKTHATAAADSYAKRYLVKDIFNISIGEYDTDGNLPTQSNGISAAEVQERCAKISNAPNMAELKAIYKAAYVEASYAGDQSAQAAYIRSKDARKRELQ